MNLEESIVPWVQEIESYLTNGSRKISELKKVLKNADFSKLNFVSRVKLAKMFDPSCKVTKQLFERQIDLYFSLLESKTKPIQIPVFSDYIDWVYSQNLDEVSDATFDIITSRLMKSTATELTEPIISFMSKLPEEFDKNIDKMSNARVSTLIDILKGTGNGYDNLPPQCQDFIKKLFIACAVKTEISDKNRSQFNGIFSENPKHYYKIFNKAFAGVSEYESWIDEPAKKIAFERMIDYADFQNEVLAYKRYGLNFNNFKFCAKQLKLPKFPTSDSDRDDECRFYSKDAKEYKAYATRLGDLFSDMIRSELRNINQNFYGNKIPDDILLEFAVTNEEKKVARRFTGSIVDNRFTEDYGNFLLDLVHLDKIMGQSKKDILLGMTATKSKETETGKKTDRKVDYSCTERLTFADRVNLGMETSADIEEKLVEYETAEKRDFDFENLMFDLETRKKELND